MMPSRIRHKPIACVALFLALGGSPIAAAPVITGASATPGGNSAATITGSFGDSCRDFTAQSSKDISHVEIHYADGRAVKNESTTTPDFSLDGGVGDEIAFAIVKSGKTSERFDCVRPNSPPTALLEIQTPPIDGTLEHCYVFFDGTGCEQSAPRTVWSSRSDLTNDQGSLLSWGCGALTDFSLCSPTFSFRGTSSGDPDDNITSWSIDFGDGTSASGGWSTEPPTEVMHTYAYPVSNFTCGGGSYCVVTLTLTDSAGQSGSDSITMVFVDQRPD